MEPPVSVHVARGQSLAATAAAEPPDEPPGTTSPVGQAIFELAKVHGKWRVIAEYFRFKIDKPKRHSHRRH